MATPRSVTLKLAPTIRHRWRWLALMLLTVAAVLAVVAALSQMSTLRAVGTYLTGPEVVAEAQFQGEGCGAHLRWGQDPLSIPTGTRVHFANETGFWQFPVLIERWEDGQVEIVAESPALAVGERWSYVFWEPGQYRMTSSKSMVRLAGLEGSINVRPS